MLTLVLTFRLQNGKTFRLSIPDPKSNLTAQEVENVMNLIIQKNIFSVSAPIVEKVSARIIDRNVNQLIG
ncbi:DUF2922 domain-containing protein [Caldicellulosiruptor changbaiensis]|uniref:DUF2922 domain-containing protein n=2 Tax=Caldicellulosiruptor TaxID=44000 RepID=A0A3T0D385_9FIRM|nr:MULTISPECIES: DUF2922 domain-containing protein [Caldicellulosiruptor]AZT89276.1 DUF2922 domain-containing protein [Caldicellulosiruptor changbaiensis]WAM31616.1 DUF2922 domain-containing protein [Caldicellulosiruptor naganoensis]